MSRLTKKIKAKSRKKGFKTSSVKDWYPKLGSFTGVRKVFIFSKPKEETRKSVRKLTKETVIKPIRQRPIRKTKKAVMKQPRYFRTARRVFIVGVLACSAADFAVIAGRGVAEEAFAVGVVAAG